MLPDCWSAPGTRLALGKGTVSFRHALYSFVIMAGSDVVVPPHQDLLLLYFSVTGTSQEISEETHGHRLRQQDLRCHFLDESDG